ncbi:hypothetical protein MPER_05177 [Moniliophthora perniciosa FA553]|nr:hypothetical protein MPER_05177 [Moniliophthora perniciosa FA553]
MEKLQKKVDGSKPSSLKSVVLALFVLVGWFMLPLNPWLDSRRPSSSSPGFSSLENHCADSKPIQASEFHDRQKALVETLQSLNASAYIAEPGANALYYANVSSSYWHLSERPLLVAITLKVQEDGSVEPQLAVLAPKFEAARANLLNIPFDNIQYEYWPEEANPYQTLISALSISEGRIFVDGSIRHFIADGLQAAYGQGSVVSAPQEVKRLRERKSAAEIELLKCANEATLLALRAVHKKMYIGMLESEARSMMTSALTAVGLQNGGCLTLFGG